MERKWKREEGRGRKRNVDGKKEIERQKKTQRKIQIKKVSTIARKKRRRRGDY